MCFVEEHDEFGFVCIADFGQGFKQFGQKPQQKCAVHARGAHQFFRIQDVDDAFPALALQPVLQVQFGFAEKLFRAFFFQYQQLPLNRADAGGGNVAVLGAVFFGVVGHILQYPAQVFQINQMPAFVVGNLEYQVEQAFLGVVQIHQAREQHRPHFGYGNAHGDARFAEYVPKAHGKALQIVCAVQTEFRHPFADLARTVPGTADAGQIAFYVNQKHRHADIAETFRHFAQRNRFARTGRAGNQAVPVGHFADKFQRLAVAAAQGDGESSHKIKLP